MSHMTMQRPSTLVLLCLPRVHKEAPARSTAPKVRPRPPPEGAVPVSDGEMAVAVPLARGTARAAGGRDEAAGIGGRGGVAVVNSPPPQGLYWSLDRSRYGGWWKCLVGLQNHQLSM